MINKDDLEQILQKYFADYTSEHIYVLIIFFLLTIIFQILQAIYVSRKIEKFKNELKISEIKFSTYNKLQIDALKIIYDKTVTFHYMNFRLFYPETYGHSSLKYKIVNWKKEYSILIDTLHRERILLSPEVELIVRKIDVDFKKVIKILNLELQSLSEIEEHHETIEPQEIYGTPESEVESIKKRIEKLNTYGEIINSEDLIISFRNKIEEYFANLTK